MGSPDSYWFCRLHDDNLSGSAMPKSDLGETLSVMIALSCMTLIDDYGNEAFGGPMKAYVAYAIKPTFYADHQEEYMACAAQYGNDLNTIANALYQALVPYVNDQRIGNEVELIGAYLNGAWGNNGDEQALEEACLLLERHLQREGTELFQPGNWLMLAQYVDFERWHDAKYGNHIDGRSKYFGKDENGNPRSDNNSSSGGANSKKSSGGCYVATAVYGTYDCPEVWTLRRFRDYRLAESGLGRLFIRTYYAVSPKIVRLFGDTQWFNKFWRARLDAMVARLNQEGFENTPYSD